MSRLGWSGSPAVIGHGAIADNDSCSSVDIATSEGPVNLAWPQIMKTINEDPYQFYKDGGWGFLTGFGDQVRGEPQRDVARPGLILPAQSGRRRRVDRRRGRVQGEFDRGRVERGQRGRVG